MGKINVLDQHVANMIAAGEVVDRPASVIKELCENSIDAGSTAITVEIKNGGSSFMRVSDNGSGIYPDDMPVTIVRHATSKISTEDDLEAISTLGFRGEALAAISAVSKFRIISRPPDCENGTLLCSVDGEITEISETGAKYGTTIIVEELFASYPARRKFLKRDATETMAVTGVVEKMILSRPDVSFKLITDGTLKLMSSGDGNLQNAVYSIFGRDFALRLIPIDYMSSGIRITGYIGSPDNVRPNRNLQNFFINDRYVKSKTAIAALEQAFTSYIPSEKFPCCVLYVTIHPALVDVNVHPAKLEVKFSNEKIIFDAIYYAVRTALQSKISTPSASAVSRKAGGFHDTAGIQRGAVTDKTSPSSENTASINVFGISSVTGSAEEILKAKAEEGKKLVSSFVPLPVRENTSGSSNAQSHVLKPDLAALEGISPESTVSEKTDINAVENTNINTAESADINTVKNGVAGDGSDGKAGREIANDVGSGNASPISQKSANAAYPNDGIQISIPNLNYTKQQNTNTNVFADSVSGTEIPEKPKGLDVSKMPATSEEYFRINSGFGIDRDLPFYKIIGELFNSYVVVELTDEILLIDKHAAHERFLFEEMKENLKSSSKASQIILVPMKIKLSAEEYAAVNEFRREIRATGFEFELSEKNLSATVYSAPLFIESKDISDVFTEIAGKLADGTGSIAIERDNIYEKSLYQASCKAAIKAGRIYDPQMIKWLCVRVLSLDNIKFCPHGRPVAITVPRHDFEKMFKRT